MIRTYEDAINVLAERTYENRQQLKRMKEQRRVTFVDLYGVPFTAQGDGTTNATFYISISPDLIYYERFAFKLAIEPFQSSVTGASGGEMSIGSTSLSGGGETSSIITGTSTLESTGGGVTPNPHTHSASGELGGLTYGVKKQATTSENWTITIGGLDITDYLIEQQDGDWIDGQGVFPTNRGLDIEDMYDILDVACMLEAEHQSTDPLLKPEFKRVEIGSDAPFRATMYLYLKYSHTNR